MLLFYHKQVGIEGLDLAVREREVKVANIGVRGIVGGHVYLKHDTVAWKESTGRRIRGAGSDKCLPGIRRCGVDTDRDTAGGQTSGRITSVYLITDVRIGRAADSAAKRCLSGSEFLERSR